MKILVTGGAGFIGSYLVEQLVNQGLETIVFDNLSSGEITNIKSSLSNIRLIEGDIRNLDTLISAMEGVDWVFHLAAQTTVSGSLTDPFLTHEVNNTGTLNVLWAAVKVGVSRVVISSSCSVYGDRHLSPLKETFLPNPKSPYAASKLTAEGLAQSFYHSYGLETVCLRYFNVYGERQNPHSDYAAVIPRFIEFYQTKQPPQIYGDGLQSRDFIHVTDVAKANILAASLPSNILGKHQIFNIGTGKSTTLLKLLEIISNTAGYHIPPMFQPPRTADIQTSCADCTITKEYLKFIAGVELESGLKQLYHHHL